MQENWVPGGVAGAAQFGPGGAPSAAAVTDTTLQIIRALLAEADPVPQPKPLSFVSNRAPAGSSRMETSNAVAAPPSLAELYAAQDAEVYESEDCAPEAESQLSWRRVEVVEGVTGRTLRRVVMSPRMVSIMFLCSVVIWQPLFIPALALLLISVVLLIGALIGQDRMARIVLYLLKRFVWADPSLGRLLQRLLPKRWHGILYRPVTEADAWDGFVDPSFEARLSRIKKS